MNKPGIEQLLVKARRRRSLPDTVTRRQIRRSLGLSQVDLARVLGVDRATVCRYELGVRVPRGVVLERYIAVLDRLAREGFAS